MQGAFLLGAGVESPTKKATEIKEQACNSLNCKVNSGCFKTRKGRTNMKKTIYLQLFADDAANGTAPGTAEKADDGKAAAETGKDEAAKPEKKYTDEEVEKMKQILDSMRG